MRALRRNKRKIYFANLDSEKPIKDEWGNEKGEYESVYGAPQPVFVSVSSAQGESYSQPFGNLLDYDRTIFDTVTLIQESSRLWVDETDPTKPHDYIVKRIAPSFNGVVVAIKKVKVSG